MNSNCSPPREAVIASAGCAKQSRKKSVFTGLLRVLLAMTASRRRVVTINSIKQIFSLAITVGLILSNTNALAAASHYCLETNQIISEGDTMERAHAVCGAPNYVIIRDQNVSNPVEITEWVYINRPVDPTKTSNYLPRLVVVFSPQGTVTQIKQSQIQDNSQTNVPCDVGGVKIGDNMPTVHINCGAPAFINRRQSSEELTKKIVEWIYQKTPNATPLAFRFENGILVQIKNG